MATACLLEKVNRLGADEQCALVDRFFSIAFGDSALNHTLRNVDIDAVTLEKLVGLAFQSRNEAAGRRRAPGVVSKIDADDRANQARSSVFNRLVQTPGAATFTTLLRFREVPGFPVSSIRLRALAEERAVQDSECAPWAPTEAFEFEHHKETAPRTAKDLQSVIVRRLKDIQHDLIHGDFAQGLTVRALPNEAEVQRWIAERLRQKQGRSFSVEREPHVAGEKEPDIRVQAKSTHAKVAVEIKVTKSWTLKELDEALDLQLCGRYLRAQDGRHGILLLVHQKARSWKDTTTGKLLTFHDVIARLSSRAAIIAGQGYDAPQPEVAWFDVSEYS